MYTGLMAEKMVGLFVRLAPDLHASLVARARQDNRSLNNLIVTWLRRGLEEGW
jgi:predicted HicB family RNase H-like nuclease